MSTADFAVGDRVYMWNNVTQQLDMESSVAQVLDSELSYGSTVLPAGSVGVSSILDPAQTWWVSPEHFDIMLRKVTPKADAKTIDEKEDQDKLPTREKEEAEDPFAKALGMVSQFFAGFGPRSGQDSKSKDNSGGQANVSDANFQNKVNAPAVTPAPSTVTTQMPVTDFAEGDLVEMWNYEKNEWKEGGMVQQVLSSPVSAGDVQLPAGSLLVSFAGVFKWFTPDVITLAVRAVNSPSAVAQSSGSLASAPSGSLSASQATLRPLSPPAPSSPQPSPPSSPRSPSPDIADSKDEESAPPQTSTASPGKLALPTVDSQPSTAPGTASQSPLATPRGDSGSLKDPAYDRRLHRLLIVGPGFGRDLNQQQGQMLEAAGFQIRWLVDLPNPETIGFPMMQYLPQIQQTIDEYQPHLLACASKGGAYVTAVWQAGIWNGPTLFINRHPSLTCLPRGTTVVLAHGSNDEFYKNRREDLENLMRTGSENRCWLYYTANSGLLGRGYTRQGDMHNMESLKHWDCLPRLVDAALSDCPEAQMMRSWGSMLTQERLEAEAWLGYTPGVRGVRRLWQSKEQKGMDDEILFEVPPSSEEYAKVATLFRSQPAVPRAYADMNPGMWNHMNIVKIERVENGMQEDGSAEPYYKALQRGIENQGVPFQPGLHTRWAFHGSSAVDSIVSNPISGFQPLMSGTRSNALWGPGTYFARDAKYVYDGGFCNCQMDGSKQILLCLLMNGFVCLGDPEHKGVLPMRQGRHRYNSSVDSLSNPEIFVTQSPGAAYPAYVITFS